MAAKAEAVIVLSVKVSPKTLSLSHSDQELVVNVTARPIRSSKPSSGILMNARWTALDTDNGVFKGALYAKSTNGKTYFGLAPPVRVSYSREGWTDDLRHSSFEHFVCVPSLDSGVALNIKQTLTVGRLFQFSSIKIADVEPDTSLRIHLSEHYLPAHWWRFADEAEGMKLFEGILPDQYGLNGMNSDDPRTVEERESEGWLYSYPLDDLSFQIKDDGPDSCFVLVD